MDDLVNKEYNQTKNKIIIGNDFSHIKTGKDLRRSLIKYAIYFGLAFELMYATEIIDASKNVFTKSYNSLRQQINNIQIIRPENIYE